MIQGTLKTLIIHITLNPHNIMTMKSKICTLIGLNVPQYREIINNLSLRCFPKKI